jgi:predicted PurR-regulated permease PerM
LGVGERVSEKKLVVSTYLQYILIVLGALILFAFVRQLGSVLLTFLLAAILAYVLNLLVRRLEARRILRVVAVTRAFVALVVGVLAALLVLILLAAGQVQALIQSPEVLTDGATNLLNRARELHYTREQIAAVDWETAAQFVQSNAPSAGQILNGALGFVGGILAFSARYSTSCSC